jgi:hypothetical protein
MTHPSTEMTRVQEQNLRNDNCQQRNGRLIKKSFNIYESHVLYDMGLHTGSTK